MTLKNDEKSEDVLTCRFKIDIRNLTNFDSRNQVSKIYALMDCFWPKHIMFEVRKYRGVMFDGNQEWYKIGRKTELCLQKWHEEFGKFSSEHLKASKLEPWWDLLCKVENVWA